jgi:hypothetical protein
MPLTRNVLVTAKRCEGVRAARGGNDGGYVPYSVLEDLN